MIVAQIKGCSLLALLALPSGYCMLVVFSMHVFNIVLIYTSWTRDNLVRLGFCPCVATVEQM